MFYAGIDIAKRKHEVPIIDTKRRALSQSLSFANDREGSNRLLALFERLNISAQELVIGMEATGHYWLSLYSWLLEKGIAQLMRFGDYSATRLSEENIHALKQLSRYCLSLVEKCGNCKRKVIVLFDQVFPEYETLFSDTFGTTSKELLLNCPTPEDILAISSRKLTTLLTKTSKGRFRDEKAN